MLLTSAVISGLGLGSMYGLIALGFHVTYVVSNTVNFSQGSAMMLGAVLGYTFAVTLGWPLTALTLLHRWHGRGLSLISPFYGTFDLTYGMLFPDKAHQLLAWGLGWALAHAVVAVALVLATLATFDRCLGRMPSAAGRGLPVTPPSRERPAGGRAWNDCGRSRSRSQSRVRPARSAARRGWDTASRAPGHAA